MRVEVDGISVTLPDGVCAAGFDLPGLCAFGRRVPAAVRSLARAYGDRLAGWGGER